jgi:hypothetical protein
MPLWVGYRWVDIWPLSLIHAPFRLVQLCTQQMNVSYHAHDINLSMENDNIEFGCSKFADPSRRTVHHPPGLHPFLVLLYDSCTGTNSSLHLHHLPLYLCWYNVQSPLHVLHAVFGHCMPVRCTPEFFLEKFVLHNFQQQVNTRRAKREESTWIIQSSNFCWRFRPDATFIVGGRVSSPHDVRIAE